MIVLIAAAVLAVAALLFRRYVAGMTRPSAPVPEPDLDAEWASLLADWNAARRARERAALDTALDRLHLTDGPPTA